ncbi:diguanylate cyclase [Thermosulfuriphilus ammonigenes]|uniref:diguanylate cyclase n=1 Tax=Thermosulfuriphilus ammonigenes TaxID=1936021 RepID=A0A6G7PV22_9BACT|nr:diguanylate cyclase [Thermosulfuriphilus ammonigenes]MBA2848308.1 diguanylate cyclase (GGDEF)-like protein [Thermosulfuriphilus ammonigenes]QIJ71534.1 diguanylate cyclase [Thermosulfuriphilus ammonigenes]
MPGEMDIAEKKQAKLLLVDDDASVLSLLAEFVAHLGYPYKTAKDGLEALKRLEKEDFDVVITDLIMPRLDGLSLIKEIKKHWPEVDVIVITGYGREFRYSDVIKAGASDFINKPFDLDELEAKLSRVLRERALLAELQRLTREDPLTGLYNRRFFEDKLKEECHRAWRLKHPLFLMMIDIDHFKEYNDTYGHQAGDEVLKGLAEVIKSSIRQNVDWGFRYGGDEFSVIVTHAGPEEIRKVAERIRRRYEAKNFEPTSISIGVAPFRCQNDPSPRDIDDLIFRADEALYEAKKAGGNKIIVAD